MATIQFNQEEYYKGLTIIEKGFKEEEEVNYKQVESDLSSFISIKEILELLNTTLLTYHTFLEDDIVKFRQIGNKIVETDEKISKHIGE